MLVLQKLSAFADANVSTMLLNDTIVKPVTFNLKKLQRWQALICHNCNAICSSVSLFDWTPVCPNNLKSSN